MAGTLRRELLDQLLIVNEHHLRRVLDEYLRHYNTARPHRALGQHTPAQAGTRPPEPVDLAERPIRWKQVLGGLTHEYYIVALPPHAARRDAGHPAESHFRAPQGPPEMTRVPTACFQRCSPRAATRWSGRPLEIGSSRSRRQETADQRPWHRFGIPQPQFR